MPLSENEQQIFAEIKKSLQESDPKFAKELESRAAYKKALSFLRWPVAGMILGFAIMVSMLLVHYLAAFAGFVIMFISALFMERNFRIIGKVGIKDISSAISSYKPSEPKSDTE